MICDPSDRQNVCDEQFKVVHLFVLLALSTHGENWGIHFSWVFGAQGQSDTVWKVAEVLGDYKAAIAVGF